MLRIKEAVIPNPSCANPSARQSGRIGSLIANARQPATIRNGNAVSLDRPARKANAKTDAPRHPSRQAITRMSDADAAMASLKLECAYTRNGPKRRIAAKPQAPSLERRSKDLL